MELEYQVGKVTLSCCRRAWRFCGGQALTLQWTCVCGSHWILIHFKRMLLHDNCSVSSGLQAGKFLSCGLCADQRHQAPHNIQ